MSRISLLLVAVAVSAGAVGCAQCDTCDDFPAPCVGPNCGQNRGGVLDYLPPGEGRPLGTGATAPMSATARSSDSAGPAPNSPPTPSAEPFPVDLVNGLLTRVDKENFRVIALIRGNRRHPEQARSRQMTSVSADLKNSLRVATAHPSNPQAQAFAWNLLDRALRDANGLIEVTEAEQRLINLESTQR